jgi:hypothetical protein
MEISKRAQDKIELEGQAVNEARRLENSKREAWKRKRDEDMERISELKRQKLVAKQQQEEVRLLESLL